MRAGVDESVRLAGLAAGNEDRLAADECGEIVVRVRDLAFMGEIDPVALEDVPHFQFEQLRIRENVAAYPILARLRVVFYGRIDGSLDAVHSFSPALFD